MEYGVEMTITDHGAEKSGSRRSGQVQMSSDAPDGESGVGLLQIDDTVAAQRFGDLVDNGCVSVL